MNLVIMEASSREVLEAYVEAVERGEPERIEFWRYVVVERLVMMHAALTDYYRTGGTDRDEPEGR